MSLPPEQAPDDTEIAAEYVLRVLKPDAHRAAAIRAATDPVFAAEVRAWEDRLAPMMDEVDPVPPRPATRDALMTRLFGHAQPTGPSGSTSVWQVLTAIGFAAAAALAVMMFAPQIAPPPSADDARFVAELAVEDGSTRMFAVFEPASRTLDIAWTARNQPENRVFELWAIPEGQDPISIGVLPPGRTATLAVPEALTGIGEGLVLAISDEPPGGSTTGAPTGAILAATPISTL